MPLIVGYIYMQSSLPWRCSPLNLKDPFQFPMIHADNLRVTTLSKISLKGF